MCVGKPCKIENFYKTFHRQQNLIERNVAFYGSYFQEDDAAEIQQNIKNVFEVDKIEQFLSEKKKLEILSYHPQINLISEFLIFSFRIKIVLF